MLNAIASEPVIKEARKIKVYDYREGENYLVGITSSRSEKGHFRVCGIDEYGYFCTCQGSFHGICGHIVALLNKSINRERFINNYLRYKEEGFKLDKQTLMNKLAEKGMFLQTSLRGLNYQIAGLAQRTLTLIYGPPKVGKSTLAGQLTWEYMKATGKNVLYIGTEGGEEIALYSWKIQGFDDRYQISPSLIKVIPEVTVTETEVEESVKAEDDKKGKRKRRRVELAKLYYEDIDKGKDKLNIYILEARRFIPLLNLHGYPILSEATESGKITVRVGQPKEGIALPVTENTPIGIICKEKNIGMIIYDSVSMPFREFVGGQLNFPSRADTEALLYIQAQELSAKFGIVVLGIGQPTQNQADRFDIMKPIGGNVVLHNFKIQLKMDFIRTPMGKPLISGKNANVRRILVDRFFSTKTGTQAGYSTLELSDEGYKDMDVIPQIKEEDAVVEEVKGEVT